MEKVPSVGYRDTIAAPTATFAGPTPLRVIRDTGLPMLVYAVTIFVSAFLLFLVQPLAAKQILPWFGGSSSVWTTCLFFFQAVLLAGYAYSDWSARRLSPRMQVGVHIGLLAISLVFLPIIPDLAWKPAGTEDPGLRIVGLLTATIGLPYFLLSTTSPLVQAWFARTLERTPYRLFALSNLASMLALAAYPFVIEPTARVVTQSIAWSVGYVVFTILVSACGLYGLTARGRTGGADPSVGATQGPIPPWTLRIYWMVLAGVGSVMLLAVSNHLTQDVASVPFLWILPLAVYLLTFILCFDSDGWYRRGLFWPLLAVALAGMALLPLFQLHLRIVVPAYLAGLFITCMFCHGELVQSKPSPRFLTIFYLSISLGGAVGAMFIALIAPHVLPGYFELQIALVACALLSLYLSMKRGDLAVIAQALLLAVVIAASWIRVGVSDRETRLMVRNFYGALRTREAQATAERPAVRMLQHGAIVHGSQFVNEATRRTPISYYGPTSGVAMLLQQGLDRPRRVGIVGLGTGTLAAFGRAGDLFRFYELNPQVVTVAHEEFTFMADSNARVETVLGDARLKLESEQSQAFDYLVVDAFSSDAIPLHLLTREAFATYLRHLKTDGVLVIHVSNRHLELAPVVRKVAASYGLEATIVDDLGRVASKGAMHPSRWVFVPLQAGFLARGPLANVVKEIPDQPGLAVWTDDFSNLFQVLK